MKEFVDFILGVVGCWFSDHQYGSKRQYAQVVKFNLMPLYKFVMSNNRSKGVYLKCCLMCFEKGWYKINKSIHFMPLKNE